MTSRRSVFTTSAVASGGAAWGTGTTVIAAGIAVGQDGMVLPMLFAFGPLVLVTERLPIPVSMFVLVPAYYAAATAAVWHAGRSRSAAVAAAVLYAILFLGPVLGVIGRLSSDARPMNLWQELEKTYDVARDLPWWFTALLVGLSTWHAFAWRRLGRFWGAAARPAAVRWLAAGLGAGLFGATLAWGAMALLGGERCGQLPGLLVTGPIVWLDDVPVPIPSYSKYAVASAALYGLTGMLLAAARDRRPAFWPAVIIWGGFSLAVTSTLAWFELAQPGLLAKEWSEIGAAFGAAPPLFLAVACGHAGWQAFVVWSLWKSRMRPRGAEADSPTPRGLP